MSQQVGWFRNKYQTPGGATFAPNVDINEIITANGYQYQATITSNIPNANLLVSMRGTIPESNIVGGSRNTSITTDSFGTATVIKDFETATSNTTFDFQTSIYNPNKLPDLNEATMAQGNVVTLSGTANKRIDVVSYSGSNTDIAKSNITVGSDIYTLYQFTTPGTFTYDITSVANVSKEIQVFTVGSGGGGANTTFQNPGGQQNCGGGGGAGGKIYTGNLTTTEGRLVCNLAVGQGGVTKLTNSSGTVNEARSNLSGTAFHTESNTLLLRTGFSSAGVFGAGYGGRQDFPNSIFFGGDGGYGQSGGGGGYAFGIGNVIQGNTPRLGRFASRPNEYYTLINSIGGGMLETQYFANVIFSGGLDANQPNIAPFYGNGNALPLSYANTTVTGNANIMIELAGETHTFGSGATGAGGVDFIYDFTGSNASYSGGGGGQFDGTYAYTGSKPLYYTGPGAGGHSHIVESGNAIDTDGKNGIVMLRHLQNGTRALSM